MKPGWRTVVASAIFLLWAAGYLLAWARVIPESPGAEMMPVVVIAVGYLLGADAIAQGRRAIRELVGGEDAEPTAPAAPSTTEAAEEATPHAEHGPAGN